MRDAVRIFVQNVKNSIRIEYGGGSLMYTIGLTGGIASGKSTVSAMLKELGAYIIDADEIAREIVMPHKPAWHDIIDHFGMEILLPDGRINREMLGGKIFKDKMERQYLEGVTHPYIKDEIEKRIDHARSIGERVIVLDIPLLFESGWVTMVDAIWVVYVEYEIQLSRLINRNQLTLQQAQERIAAQMSLDEKVKQADVVITNNLDLIYTKSQVTAAWQRI